MLSAAIMPGICLPDLGIVVVPAKVHVKAVKGDVGGVSDLLIGDQSAAFVHARRDGARGGVALAGAEGGADGAGEVGVVA